jgi:hypothetical protein
MSQGSLWRQRLLTNKLQLATGKSHLKPLITRISTDMKKQARVHLQREWGRIKTLQAGCPILAFFCQSQFAGII